MATQEDRLSKRWTVRRHLATWLPVVIGIVPWLLDKRGIDVPAWVVISGGVLAIGGIAVSLWLLLPPTREVLRIVVTTAFVVAALSWWLFWLPPQSAPKHVQFTPEAKALLGNLRAFLDQATMKDRGTLENHISVMRNAPASQRPVIQGAHDARREQLAVGWANEYSGRFKADAIALRERMLACLPQYERNMGLHLPYESPAGLFDLRAVADDLERLHRATATKRC